MAALVGISVLRCWRDVEDKLGHFGAVGCMVGCFTDRGGTADIEFSIKIAAKYLPPQPPAYPLFSLQHPVVPTLIRVWCAARPSECQSRCAIDVLIVDDDHMGMQSACMHVVLSIPHHRTRFYDRCRTHTLTTSTRSTTYPTLSKHCSCGVDHT